MRARQATCPGLPTQPGFPVDSHGKQSAGNVGNMGSNPGSGRPPGGGLGNTLQYSCLENPMDREAWQARVQRASKSLKQLIMHTCTCARTHTRTLKHNLLIFSSVQSLSLVQLFATPWTAACQASLSITNFQSLLKLMSTESVMPSNHLILCRPLLLLLSIIPSTRVFSNESLLWISWPKYWSFSFSISPSNEYSGLISLRTDWLDILAVWGTLKSLLQYHSSKASILQCSAFFMVQLSHPYMTTGKTKALARGTFVGKIMSLLFNMLSRLVITFLPRSKCILISQLQSSSVVILEPPKIKSVTVSTVSSSIFHEVVGPDSMILAFWILSFKPAFSLSSVTFIKRLFSSSSLSAIRVVSSAYLRLLIFLPAIFIPACASSSPAFRMMYSAYKLNKQGDNI